MAVYDNFVSVITNKKQFIETLLVIEDKNRNRVPFILNPIQADVHATETGRDIYVKPAQVGFSSERLASRLIDTITTPGTNTVLIAFEEFITQRLLDKAQFFYNMLESLSIPGFPKLHHRSSFEKTFPDIHSSMYISSARSFVAGRAEIIHHLLADEFAFWEPGATERILLPAIERIPETGTADIFSTPNGEDNDFHDMYWLAREGQSVFKPHFYSWFMHPEYMMTIDNTRCMPNCNTPEFDLTPDEELLVSNHGLTYDQIRWRRYKIFEMESLRRDGGTRRLFSQEYPEDDVSCFLATGDMFYDSVTIDELAKGCYPAPYHYNKAAVWYPPEEKRYYIVSIDPGQAKVTQSAITVLSFDDGIPIYCARAAGLWGLEVTADIAKELGKYYGKAVITWEANSHGLGLAPLLKNYPNLYYRRDIVSGRESSELGWLTTSKNKDFMFNVMNRKLYGMVVHDIDFVSECRNIRLAGDKVVSVGADDIHDAMCIGLMCSDTYPIQRGYVGSTGYKW
jgi:hypothetical protein